MTVLCLVEHDTDGVVDASLRAFTFARSLASEAGSGVEAVMFGEPAAVVGEQLASFGAGRASAIEVPVYAPVAWARALTQLAVARKAIAILAAGTDYGNEVMAHAGALTGLPMAASCFAASMADSPGVWRVTRHRWGGSLIEEAELTGAPALMTVSTDAVPPVPVAGDPGILAVESFTADLQDDDLAVSATESRAESGGVALANANVVVSGGRGVGGPEGFDVLEELAGLLGGAVGVSRVVTSLGWRPHSMQVGQTGTKVAPSLYLACGISGAIQHLAGCQSAKTMIAINTDPGAAIMQRADYAVIGDLHTVLPALVSALKARRGL